MDLGPSQTEPRPVSKEESDRRLS